jgi:sugar (pentulose or hexulose) kinase
MDGQPYYVLLDSAGKPLLENANYQDYGRVDLFKDWLDRGVAAFN